ncbi:thiamine biosynthesis protein ThiI [Halarchaeum rubridurum]|uniref:Probable tRNA sulfurtransferase n=1 Tax=Halarchaeum rubridurum TaxID=489911 RepID=A0A830FXR6_9EURY|nr:tRNA sulfurtransferase [Halarchaeum rubridurum]MBP1953737.1 thiamine biosynthesis protein ThiI [Halarchaeum rubridurum]GGM54289.1 tRNA 4-thiouridine(8) synthase ThiI [Halarchaeum rubridurum]
MHPPDADAVLVRHGDIGIKSRSVQTRMEERLAANLESHLDARGIEGRVEREYGRLVVHAADVEAATAAATDTFGVVSASPARVVDASLDAITDALARIAREHYRGGTFGVDARRAGEHDFGSHDIGREGGQAVWEAVEDEFDPEVDLDDPDLTFGVECRDARAFVYLEERDGPGGMPLGTQEPLVALVSGGIDSPVAAWLAMKRGAPVVPVYLDLGPYGGADHEARAVETVRHLATWAPDQDLDVRRVPAGEAVERLDAEVGNTRMLSFRRFMYRVAEHVARDVGAVGIVTGEAIGQKSSQTTANMAAVAGASDLPVHRPLLSWDKQDVIARARDLGTYRDATMNVGCDRLAPAQPATAASAERVVAAEPDDLLDLAAAAAADRDIVSVEPVAVEPEPEASP